MSEPRTPRVFRFLDAKSGTFQIAQFPDVAPDDINDLMRRTRHITEIECFANLAYNLVAGDPTKVSLPEIQAVIDALDTATEALVDQINQISASRPNATRRIEQEMQERREKA